MKKILVAAMAVLMALPATGRSMRDLLASESGRVFATLPVATRLDMIDYFDAGRTPALETVTGGSATLTALEPAYARVELEGAGNIQLRMMAHGRDTVIAVVETVALPVADSRLTFYDTQWRPLETKRHIKPEPTLDRMIDRGVSRAERDSVMRAVVFPVAEMTFEGDELLVTPRLAEFHAADEPVAALLRRVLRPLRYRISGTRLVSSSRPS